MEPRTRRWSVVGVLLVLGAVVPWALLRGGPGPDVTPSPEDASAPVAAASAAVAEPAVASPSLDAGRPSTSGTEGTARAPLRVKVVRDNAAVAGARVSVANVGLPDAYYDRGNGPAFSRCLPAGVPAVVAALRRGVSASPAGEAVTDVEGFAELLVARDLGGVQVHAEDPASGARGVVLQHWNVLAHEGALLVPLVEEGVPSLTITPRGEATATAFDAERLALVDLPVDGSGAVSFGAVRFGVVFVEAPAHDARALDVWPGFQGVTELVPLSGRVRVELGPHVPPGALVELNHFCRRWQQQAVGGVVTANELPAEGYVLARLLGPPAVMDDDAVGVLSRGETTQIRLGLKPAATVVVSVFNDQGAPVVPLQVSIGTASWSEYKTVIPEARPPPYELGPLTSGPMMLEVATEDFEAHQQAVDLVAGRNELVVRLTDRRLQVTGRLRHHAGREVASRNANSRTRCFDDGTCERTPVDGYVEVELDVEPLEEGTGRRRGGLEIVSKGPVGELQGWLGRGRWRVRGWGSDGSVLREVEFSVPGPPLELLLLPPPSEP